MRWCYITISMGISLYLISWNYSISALQLHVGVKSTKNKIKIIMIQSKKRIHNWAIWRVHKSCGRHTQCLWQRWLNINYISSSLLPFSYVYSFDGCCYCGCYPLQWKINSNIKRIIIQKLQSDMFDLRKSLAICTNNFK